jgi:nicotinamidase-related amidase
MMKTRFALDSEGEKVAGNLFALRDAQVAAFVIVGVATEVGIEPTVRHGADLGLIPVVVTDACGAGNSFAGKRSLDALAFAGDAVLTDAVMRASTVDLARKDRRRLRSG